MKRTRAIILFSLVMLLLVGCVPDSPEGAAKEWFKAEINLDGNKILDRTCESQKENVQTAGLYSSAIALLPQMFGFDIKTSGDVSDIKFSTESLDGDSATVRVYGKMRMAVLAFAQEYPVDETWIMVKEDDIWKWCGVQ